MTTYESRLHRFFDIQSTNQQYLKLGTLTQHEFDAAIQKTVQIRRLYLSGLDWLLMDQLFGALRHVPILHHCEALSAGLKRPFRGMEDLFRVLTDLELIPAGSLNRTQFYRVPQGEKPIGELLVELGLVTAIDLQRALGIQEIIRHRAGTHVAIGQIFRSLCNVSVIDFFQAVSLQVQVPFETLDASAPEIWEKVRLRATRASVAG